jgi:hypothetical protein
MCINCWKENGSASIVNDKTIKGAELVKELYETEDGGAGGYGHCEFDDWNLSGSFKSSVDDAIANKYNKCEETVEASIKALEYFETLTEPERYSALALVDGFIKVK